MNRKHGCLRFYPTVKSICWLRGHSFKTVPTNDGHPNRHWPIAGSSTAMLVGPLLAVAVPCWQFNWGRTPPRTAGSGMARRSGTPHSFHCQLQWPTTTIRSAMGSAAMSLLTEPLGVVVKVVASVALMALVPHATVQVRQFVSIHCKRW